MRIKFLGTGAAEGVPAAFCECEVCREVRRRGEGEFHTRSQILIDGELSIDYPPDAYAHSLRFGFEQAGIKYLFVTHSHMDHFYAHDFVLRGYKYCSPVREPLYIFGNAEVKKVFEECTRRELKEEVASGLFFVVAEPFCERTFGEYTVFPLRAQHSKTEDALTFYIRKGDKGYLHLTDTGRLPKESLDRLEAYLKEKGWQADLVTFDCTFLFRTAGEVSRHMGLGDNMVMKEELTARGLVNEGTMYAITHYSHNNLPLKETLLRAEKEYGVVAAFDGLELSV